MAVNYEKYVCNKVMEEIETYMRWLEHEYSNNPSKDLYNHLQSTYWVYDIFPLVYNSSLYKVNKSKREVVKASVTNKVVKVFLSIRQVALNGWKSSTVDVIVNDIARRVFSTDILS